MIPLFIYGPALTRRIGKVAFTAYYRLYALLDARLPEGKSTVHNAVVGYGDGILSAFPCGLRYFAYTACTVKQAVLRMEV